MEYIYFDTCFENCLMLRRYPIMSNYFIHLDISYGCTLLTLIKVLKQLSMRIDLDASCDELKKPIVNTLVKKISDLLKMNGYNLSIFEEIELIEFCTLLHTLNPSAVSSTKLPLSFPCEFSDSEDIILKLSKEMPVREYEWPGPTCDPLSIAVLKTCVTSFSARGESILREFISYGNPPVRALWCQKISNKYQVAMDLTLEISSWIKNSDTIPELIFDLNKIGAKKIWTTQIMNHANSWQSCLHVIVRESEKNSIIEYIFRTGLASEIEIKNIEQISLQKRIVAVTLNKQQKQQTCRLTEYLLAEKILWADPLREDLEIISKSTSYSQEIIREDVLSIWKKNKNNFSN